MHRTQRKNCIIHLQPTSMSVEDSANVSFHGHKGYLIPITNLKVHYSYQAHHYATQKDLKIYFFLIVDFSPGVLNSVIEYVT